jgi:predicted DNA-binding protein
MARSKSKGFRLDLGDELEAKLEDFCAAYYDGKKTTIIREALEAYIDSTLANEPERRNRYDAARRRRGIATEPPVRLVPRRRSPKGQTNRNEDDP